MVVEEQLSPEGHRPSTDDSPNLPHRTCWSADAQLGPISCDHDPVEDAVNHLIVVGSLDHRLHILVVEHAPSLPHQGPEVILSQVVRLLGPQVTVVRAEVVALLLKVR